MKFIPSAFYTDTLLISRWELVKLFFGVTLKEGALKVMTEQLTN